jgi:hypothetical protein
MDDVYACWLAETRHVVNVHSMAPLQGGVVRQSALRCVLSAASRTNKHWV